MFDLEKTEVESTADGGYFLQWATHTPGIPVTVYSGPSSKLIDFSTPLATTTQTEINLSGLNKGFRRYFYLQTDQEGMLVGERRLPLSGAKNFRDLGGYEGADGRCIKWGLLYRSGRLDELTEADQDYFSSLNIGLICDFRREDEQIKCPSRLPEGNDINRVDLPIVAGSNERFLEELEARQTNDDVMKGIMEDIYLDFARNQTGPYGEMFSHMLNVDGEGMLIHCTAGKDRTGFGTALILAALGVPCDTIMSDYLLTMRYFPIEHEMRTMAEKYEVPLDFYMQTMRPVFEVHPRYLRAAFDEIEKEYGTMDDYLREALGVSEKMQTELKAKFLEK